MRKGLIFSQITSLMASLRLWSSCRSRITMIRIVNFNATLISELLNIGHSKALPLGSISFKKFTAEMANLLRDSRILPGKISYYFSL